MIMRRLKKKLKRPRRPWDSSRLDEEAKVLREFGLRRKREIWSAEEIVRNFRRRARNLIAVKDEKKAKIMLDRLVSMGLIQKGQGLEYVLQLKVNDLLNRRLQTLVFKKGFASTVNGARQSITHGHIYVAGRRTTFPACIVPIENENLIEIRGGKK
jgi:small subunit ribosomal protein S4